MLKDLHSASNRRESQNAFLRRKKGTVATRPHSSALGRTSGLVVRSDLAGAMVLVQRAAARATCRAGFVQYDILWRLEESAMAPRCGGWAVRNRKEQSIGSRFVNRATLAALVRGPARHASHPCPAQKAGPCSNNRVSQAAAGIARHMTAGAPAGFLDSGNGLTRYTLSRSRWRKIRAPTATGQTISTAVCHSLNARYSAAIWNFPQLPE